MIIVKRIIPTFTIFFLLCFSPTFAISNVYFCDTPPFNYWDDAVESQTYFVKIPTGIGANVGGYTGLIVGGVIGFPVGLIYLSLKADIFLKLLV